MSWENKKFSQLALSFIKIADFAATVVSVTKIMAVASTLHSWKVASMTKQKFWNSSMKTQKRRNEKKSYHSKTFLSQRKKTRDISL